LNQFVWQNYRDGKQVRGSYNRWTLFKTQVDSKQMAVPTTTFSTIRQPPGKMRRLLITRLGRMASSSFLSMATLAGTRMMAKVLVSCTVMPWGLGRTSTARETLFRIRTKVFVSSSVIRI
jgi:hypothetical protein